MRIMDGLDLFFLIFTATISSIRSQYISPDPSFVVTGGNVTLTCHHPSHSGGAATVSWIQGGISSLGSDVLNDTRLEREGSNLFISSFRASELAGSYTCIVDPAEESSSSDILVSCPAEVKHAHIQSGFQIEPKNTTTFVGSSAVLHCQPRQSVPQAEITWTRSGQTLDLTSDSQLSLSPSGNLYILKANASDQGEYRCFATNTVSGVSRKSREATLEVNYYDENTTGIPFSFAVEPANTTVMEGSPLVLECAGRGHPQPYEAWEKFQSVRLPEGLHVMPTGELVFENVSRSHSGIYICRLRDQNHTEVAIKQIMLTVKVPPHFIATPPPQLSLERAGNIPTVISCSAAATDPLNLYLLHNGEVLNMSTGVNITVQATLTPPSSDQLNSNIIYQCIATGSNRCTKHDITVTYNDLATPGTTPTYDVTTPTSSYLTPEGSGSTMEPEPTLDVMTTESIRKAHIGDQNVRSECEVTVSNDEEIQVSWLFGGRDLESDPIPGVTVLKLQQENRKVLAYLSFDPVMAVHDGLYTCKATTVQSLLTVTANITLSVLDTEITQPEMTTTTPSGEVITPTVDTAPLPPPSNIEIQRFPIGNDLYITWRLPTSHESISGFKINWDTPDRISLSARDSLPIVSGRTSYTYVISNLKYNYLVPLKVYLWSYNIDGDGLPVVVEVTPQIVSTTTTTTTTTTTSEPSTPNHQVLECQATAISPTSIHIKVPAALADEGDSLIYLTTQCEEAGTSISTTFTTSLSHFIDQALPGCSYIIELRSTRLAVCQVNTPSGQVDIQATVNRFPNGTVSLTWNLPPEIETSNGLSIEVNWGKGWIPVTAGLHTPTHFEAGKQYQVQLRFRHGWWEGTLNVTIPAAGPGESTDSKLTEISLLYSIIFGGIVLGCALLLVVILGLKYVQWSRRDTDKVTNYREKSKEEFQRMSMNRSSMNSIKSIKI